MDEPRYQQLADQALRRIERALGDFDPDEIDCVLAGDVLTVTFGNGSVCVVNTQRPTRQLWVAANARAWHFSYDEARGEWRWEKDANVELFAELARIVKDNAAKPVAF